jgi:WD40 repeat protein
MDSAILCRRLGAGDEMQTKPSVVIVDDEPDLRLLMRRWVEQCNEAQVVGEAADGRQALAIIEALRPTIVVDGSFSISGNGKYLVYARAAFHSNLRSVEIGSSGSDQATPSSQLTYGTDLIERPRISPDGKKIVFNMGHEGLANLYTIPITGGVPKQLTFLNSFSLGGAWAPDGKSVAFASNEDGRPRVWVVNADGGQPHPVSSGEISNSFDIAWAPGPDILYQQPGNRNYYSLDPVSRKESMLARDSSPGWIFSPAYSPDLSRVAFTWSRSAFGIWTIDFRDSKETFVSPAMPLLIGWSADGTSIYGIDGKRAATRGLATNSSETLTEAQILEVPLAGGSPKPLATLPFDEIGGVAITPDGRWIVCTVYTSTSDVWLVENFDPQ